MTTGSEAFASDSEIFVLNLGWIPDACAFLASRLLFRPLPRGSRSPGSDGSSPVRASGSLAPPTSAATPHSKDLCWCEETRRFYFLQSWRFVSLLLLREELCCGRLDFSFFLLYEVRSLGLADITAFSRLPCFAGRRRPVRPPRSCLTRWLPSLAPLS